MEEPRPHYVACASDERLEFLELAQVRPAGCLRSGPLTEVKLPLTRAVNRALQATAGLDLLDMAVLLRRPSQRHALAV
jgi:hypothetical protein